MKQEQVWSSYMGNLRASDDTLERDAGQAAAKHKEGVFIGGCPWHVVNLYRGYSPICSLSKEMSHHALSLSLSEHVLFCLACLCLFLLAVCSFESLLYISTQLRQTDHSIKHSDQHDLWGDILTSAF